MLDSSASYKENIYAIVRQIEAKVHFTMNGETTTYDNTDIIRINILEETSPVNETLAQNELKVTFNNNENEFDFITFKNLSEIIASKPILSVEFGLLLFEGDAGNAIANYVGKVLNSSVANGHLFYKRSAATLQTPSQFTYQSQASYDNVKTLNGAVTAETNSVSNNIPQLLYSYDVIRILTDKYGEGVWAGKETVNERIEFAKEIINSATFKWNGNAFSKTSTVFNAYVSVWNPNTLTWENTVSQSSQAIKQLNLTGFKFGDYIDSKGFINFNSYTDASDGTPSAIQVDYSELEIIIDEFIVKEWVPMGSYYLNEWVSDRSAKTVSLVGRDSFAQLDELVYMNTAKTNLYDLAVDVFEQAGLTNYLIDDSLKSIPCVGYTVDKSSKEVLQNIGIASRCVIYQDRNGLVNIKPLYNIDVANNYLTYVGDTFFNTGINAFPLFSTGSGMRVLDFDNMFDFPQITLEKSIVQITVKVYEETGVRDVVVSNPLVTGNGEIFSIDNPLITTETQARAVADWVMRESNYNALYRSSWRQNPILECTDVVLIEDGFNASKQSRIFRQEFNYEGYLSGVTEARGGI